MIQKYGMFVHVAREQETIEGVMESNWFKVQTQQKLWDILLRQNSFNLRDILLLSFRFESLSSNTSIGITS